MLRVEFVKFNMWINFVEVDRSTVWDSKGGRDVKCLGLWVETDPHFRQCLDVI